MLVNFSIHGNGSTIEYTGDLDIEDGATVSAVFQEVVSSVPLLKGVKFEHVINRPRFTVFQTPIEVASHVVFNERFGQIKVEASS
ncbi:MAG: hypothetical protein MRY21_06985 [Simkaniaceae bacterium]|nr:hypothetical protein [Simkaniaceae bacterium]